MKLSVIIPCFNAERTIAAQLEALANQHWSEPWEVIISDGGSSDRTIAIAQQYQEKLPNLRIVDCSDRRGAAHGRNVGAQAAASEALAFCEADDEVGPGWVAAMGEALCEYDFVAGYCEIKKLNQPWAIKARSGGRLIDGWEDGIIRDNSFVKYAVAGGYTVGIKRSVHEAIGGFDESILIGDDVDYSWRVQLAGTKLHHIPDLKIHYRLRHTLADIYRQAYGYGKSSFFLYKKYQPLGIYSGPLPDAKTDWKLLLKESVKIRNKEHLAAWLWKVAYQRGYEQAFRMAQ
ncbi:glycosyltransferase [Argonema galeatum]|uniref:glycosyltransferase n=1 Tax=Argonema galeatum TaxID=2942762 RepID=UPI002012D353|nr:glycosyltransferase [Argonema galeatum]MCL1467473.1 glycosyltransferase [Argonema galeatum A003/A1]